jgi:hypothetical protein
MIINISTSSNSERKCSFCRKGGHDKRKCPSLSTAIKITTIEEEEAAAYSRILAKDIEKEKKAKLENIRQKQIIKEEQVRQKQKEGLLLIAAAEEDIQNKNSEMIMAWNAIWEAISFLEKKWIDDLNTLPPFFKAGTRYDKFIQVPDCYLGREGFGTDKRVETSPEDPIPEKTKWFDLALAVLSADSNLRALHHKYNLTHIPIKNNNLLSGILSSAILAISKHEGVLFSDINKEQEILDRNFKGLILKEFNKEKERRKLEIWKNEWGYTNYPSNQSNWSDCWRFAHPGEKGFNA